MRLEEAALRELEVLMKIKGSRRLKAKAIQNNLKGYGEHERNKLK
jgi:hypothetical protein